jgi:hypothetical protein
MHGIAKERTSSPSLLQVDTYTHEGKAQVVGQFYDVLLGRSINREHTINLHELVIPSHNLADLELPFTEDVVWLIIKKLPANKAPGPEKLPADKAPGPDVLTGRFYKSCWSIIKKDIMAAISWVWSRKMIGLTPLNTAYITLLPKKEEAGEPKDFKPISLVHSFAKLLTKMSANRLASWLNQMAKSVLYTIISC